MVYGYARVSSAEQKLDRQTDGFLSYGISKRNIFCDKISGKDFIRDNYIRLIKRLKRGDLLVIHSIDRLGRNYDMILTEWTRITKTIGADVLVLDMPMLDTRIREKDLTGRLIADIVLQLLSYVAQKERESIKERQREGIEAAKKRGVKFGRPTLKLPENFSEIAVSYRLGRLSLQEAADLAGLSKTTFFRKATTFLTTYNKNDKI